MIAVRQKIKHDNYIFILEPEEIIIITVYVPKAFWSYVNSKTRMRSGISDLKDENGTMCSRDADKANILNNFFCIGVYQGRGFSD